MNKANPSIYHNSGRNLLSGENHHPVLDSLVFGEVLEDSSPDPSTSAVCSTSMVDTSALSSSPSETSRRYAQSDPPPEMTTDCPVEEERGEIKDELESPVEQGSRGGTQSEAEEPPDLTPPAKASPNCPSDTCQENFVFTNLCRALVQVSVYTTSIFLTQVTTLIHFTSFTLNSQLNEPFKTKRNTR